MSRDGHLTADYDDYDGSEPLSPRPRNLYLRTAGEHTARMATAEQAAYDFGAAGAMRARNLRIYADYIDASNNRGLTIYPDGRVEVFQHGTFGGRPARTFTATEFAAFVIAAVESQPTTEEPTP